MATSEYLLGRKKYARPQGLIFSDNAGSWNQSRQGFVPDGDEFTDFIILADHNREPISLNQDRIETRKRMINGRMRSYWLADKLKISTSWKALPSRHAATEDRTVKGQSAYVVDYGACGSDLLEWYETHPGSFYVWIAYDNPYINGYTDFTNYTDIKECFFSSFNYTVAKRGGLFDLWDINLELEEA